MEEEKSSYKKVEVEFIKEDYFGKKNNRFNVWEDFIMSMMLKFENICQNSIAELAFKYLNRVKDHKRSLEAYIQRVKILKKKVDERNFQIMQNYFTDHDKLAYVRFKEGPKGKFVAKIHTEKIIKKNVILSVNEKIASPFSGKVLNLKERYQELYVAIASDYYNSKKI